MWRTTILAVLCGATLISASALAESDELLANVGLAVTGKDDAKVIVVDRAECVFTIEKSHTDGIGDFGTFHLKNVSPAAIDYKTFFLQLPYSSKNGLEITLSGHDVIREWDGRTTDYYNYTVFPKKTQRVMDAWSYIFEQGCVAEKKEER